MSPIFKTDAGHNSYYSAGYSIGNLQRRKQNNNPKTQRETLRKISIIKLSSSLQWIPIYSEILKSVKGRKYPKVGNKEIMGVSIYSFIKGDTCRQSKPNLGLRRK
jgi:hypothetical protein